MMTRKDFVAAAKIAAESSPEVTAAFVRFFQADNPRFDASRFLAAAAPVKIAARRLQVAA